jgi:hypothetical protein
MLMPQLVVRQELEAAAAATLFFKELVQQQEDHTLWVATNMWWILPIWSS